MDPLGDSGLRQALLCRLNAAHGTNPNALVIEELGLRHGRARVDVAIVNGFLEGFEIKSRKDTLRRLPRQISIYETVLDRVTLVCDETHVHEALDLIPTCWGVVSGHVGENSELSLEDIREPTPNSQVEALAVAKLLWREEALSELERLGKDDGVRSAPRRRLYRRLVEVLDIEALKERVRLRLRSRTDWRVDES